MIQASSANAADFFNSLLAEAELRSMREAFSNTIIYLVGPPGVRKYTVGPVLAEALPVKLVDNHYWLNPLFSLTRQDGRPPLPAEISKCLSA
jgi:hypothetical protein